MPQEEYGIRCMIQVANAWPDSTKSIADIAESEGLSEAYIGKLMNILRQGGLVESIRGRGGGYALPKAPEEISISSILDVMGGQLYEESFCERFMGDLEICAHSETCRVRALWRVLAHVVSEVLDNTSLSHLLGSEKAFVDHLTERLSTATNLGTYTVRTTQENLA
jgi:Rrf2 family protein